jgi:PPM family protein phosphatase
VSKAASPKAGELLLEAAAKTDAGRRRDHNEDVALVRDDLNLYVVADGAGGHQAGDVAADLAVRTIASFFAEGAREQELRPEFDRFGLPVGARRLSTAIHRANREVLQLSRSSRKHRGMGTTVVAASFSPQSGLLHVAHVGDSRCYRLRGGHLEQLTQDHSLLTEVLEARPDLDDGALARLPQHVVTRALGMDDQVRVAVHSFQVVGGDRYLLCSDGLSAIVPASMIAETLAEFPEPGFCVRKLIALANGAGGPDNIAALVVHCHGGHEVALPADSATDNGERPEQNHSDSDPELLILGIEELDPADRPSWAGGDLLRALDELLGKRNK